MLGGGGEMRSIFRGRVVKGGLSEVTLEQRPE